MAEAGYPGQTAETPIGIFVPAGTPAAIVDLLHRKVMALVATQDVKHKLANIGFSPIGDTPRSSRRSSGARMKSGAR